jgi:CBS domain containing-hemolysin-like protein
VSGWTVLFVTVLLLAINAFFVGAEFAAMSARRSQLEPLAEEGSKRAAVALEAMHRTGLLLATAQLGITVCSVLLGAVSEAALHHALVPVAEKLGISAFAADAVALVLAIAIVVFLHVVYGEMIPKNISIARPERAAVALVPVLVMVSRVVAPVINAMDWLSKALVRLFGVEPKDEVASAFTAEEVAHILDESRHEGLVGREHYERLGAALEFSDKDAADVGVPLAGLVTVTSAATPLDIERLVAKHGFSRYPVVDELGDLGGYLHLKDVLYADEVERLEPVPAKRVRRMGNVRRDDEVESVLQTMQITGSHLARVVADDGTVVGVVFLEDVIEELVGEVSDSSQR